MRMAQCNKNENVTRRNERSTRGGKNRNCDCWRFGAWSGLLSFSYMYIRPPNGNSQVAGIHGRMQWGFLPLRNWTTCISAWKAPNYARACQANCSIISAGLYIYSESLPRVDVEASLPTKLSLSENLGNYTNIARFDWYFRVTLFLVRTTGGFLYDERNQIDLDLSSLEVYGKKK